MYASKGPGRLAGGREFASGLARGIASLEHCRQQLEAKLAGLERDWSRASAQLAGGSDGPCLQQALRAAVAAQQVHARLDSLGIEELRLCHQQAR